MGSRPASMEYISSINHLVADTEGACKFLCEQFDFVVETKNPDFILINNGILSIRLIKANNKKTTALLLDYSVADIDFTTNELTKKGFKTCSEKQMVSQFREEIQLEASFGISILLYKHYTIDELGIYTELETTLDWTNEAVDIVQELMAEVPLDFREAAKVKVVEEAESNAIAEGETAIDYKSAIRAIVMTTPAFRKEELVTRLKTMDISHHLYESKIK